MGVPQKLSQLSDLSVPALDDVAYLVTDPAATPASYRAALRRLLGLLATSEARLTTESGVAVSTSDRSAQATLYLTPFRGNRLTLFDGVRDLLYTFSEQSLSLTGVASGNYDAFVYLHSGAVTFDLGTAWTNTSTRALDLSYHNGRLANSSSFTSLVNSHTVDVGTGHYLGSVRVTTGTVEDTLTQRFLWNNYHRRKRPLYKPVSTASWTNTSTTPQQWNADSANKVEAIIGVVEDSVTLQLLADLQGASTVAPVVGIGHNSTSAYSKMYDPAAQDPSYIYPVTIPFEETPSLGYNYWAMLESIIGSGTMTQYGTNGGDRQNGLIGYLWG